MSKQEKVWIDIKGDVVPARYVSKFDKARDAVSRRIHKRFMDERKRLEQLLRDSIADLDELMKLKASVGVKGNFQTSSFDGNIQVSIDQQYTVQLDERVAKARELMLEYVNSELARLDKDTTFLRKVVEDSFRANAKGFLPVASILKLMRYEVKDERWNEARGILQDAMRPVPGKRYLNCRVRESRQQDFRTIRLDVADCWPGENEDLGVSRDGGMDAAARDNSEERR